MSDFQSDLTCSKPIKISGPRALRKLLGRIGQLQAGRLSLFLPDGEQVHLVGVKEGPHATIVFQSMKPLARLAFGGPVAFAESYMQGEWESPDLVSIFRLVLANEAVFSKNLQTGKLGQWIDRFIHRLRTNNKKGSKRNIAYHYDLGNDFFQAWLDPSMTYSSAWFEDGCESLEAAQYQKLEKICQMAEIEAGDDILEIGCGWGGFAEYAAHHHQASVRGITLSKEQLAYSQERPQKCGLEQQAVTEYIDYRDVSGQYDRVVSIEMFEAVGEEHWSGYFQKIKEVFKARWYRAFAGDYY